MMNNCPICHKPICNDTESVNGFFCHCSGRSALNLCGCGNQPHLINYFIKGTANRINFFVKCYTCNIRTRSRRHREGAIEDWNNNIGITVPPML